MAKKTSTTTSSSSSSTHSQSQSQSQSASTSTSQSMTQKVLDTQILEAILSGLSGRMTDEETERMAQSLLEPGKNAALEASQQSYEAARLGREQEIEDLAQALTRSIGEQRNAYRQSSADVETAALARGMGRSSYTMQTLVNQGEALAGIIAALTEESGRKQAQIQRQITQAAEQNAATQGRIKADYAQSLAAKVQELREQQRQEYNSNYLTAISAAMGQKTTGMQHTAGQSTTDTTGSSTSSSQSTTTTTTTAGSSGSSGKASGKAKETDDGVDAVSGAAMSVRRRI